MGRMKGWRGVGLAVLGILLAGLLVPERLCIPVAGATRQDWHPRSFWFEPWGVSGVHKGIDIFAPSGRAVRAASAGLVVYRGDFGRGGRVVAILGPKWRVHYYAHLLHIDEKLPFFVTAGVPLGEVGRSGNAAGKPPHLHYSIVSLLPIPWRFSATETQGWQKMFYLDPGALLQSAKP